MKIKNLVRPIGTSYLHKLSEFPLCFSGALILGDAQGVCEGVEVIRWTGDCCCCCDGCSGGGGDMSRIEVASLLAALILARWKSRIAREAAGEVETLAGTSTPSSSSSSADWWWGSGSGSVDIMGTDCEVRVGVRVWV